MQFFVNRESKDSSSIVSKLKTRRKIRYISGGGLVLSIMVGCLYAAHSFSTEPQNSIFQRLEHGEVVAAKTGSSFVLQAVTNADPAKLEAAFHDLNQLPKVFSQIAFVRAYTTNDNPPRHLLYMKLRGLQDGTGVLVEVKQGGDEAFANATALRASADSLGLRDTAKEVDLTNDPSNTRLMTDADAEKKLGGDVRNVSISGSIIAEGPINPIIESPSTRVVLNLAYGTYSVTKGSAPKGAALTPDLNSPIVGETKGFLMVKVSFGNQIARGELGDYRGFGEQRLNLAQDVGIDVLKGLRARLEKL